MTGEYLAVCATCGGRARDCDCLRDIRNPSAFVHDTIRRARLVLSPEEHAELHAEGLAILHKLALDYRPQMEGYQQEGRFSGYAAMYLPRKLGDAWHRMHPEHLLVTQEAGGRQWEYREKAVSLEAILAADPDRSDLLVAATDPSDIGGRIRRALAEKWGRWIETIARVGELLSQGATPADCADVLGLDASQVQSAIKEIQTVEHRIRS